MAKGKSKSAVAVAPSASAEAKAKVKAAVGIAAILASGAAAKGLRESEAGNKEVVVASVHLSVSGKRGLTDDPPPNLTVQERVIAETAPFQMIRQKRTIEEYDKVAYEPGGEMISARRAGTNKVKKEKKEKKEKESKKEKKEKEKKVRQLGMEPPEVEDDIKSGEGKGETKRFRWI